MLFYGDGVAQDKLRAAQLLGASKQHSVQKEPAALGSASPLQSLGTAFVSRLRHSYVLVRHGFSEANALGIISCAPKLSSGFLHGLAPKGIAQASTAHHQLLSQLPGLQRQHVQIRTSDFKRCVETAELLQEGLELPPQSLQKDPRLRERDFGQLDLGPDSDYPLVWARDAERELLVRTMVYVNTIYRCAGQEPAVQSGPPAAGVYGGFQGALCIC